jgi:hypothetical protein
MTDVDLRGVLVSFVNIDALVWFARRIIECCRSELKTSGSPP